MEQRRTVNLRSLIGEDSAFGNDEGRAVYRKLQSELDAHPHLNIFGISLQGILRTDASFPRESVISLAKLNKGEKGFYLQDFTSKDLMDNWNYAAIAKDQSIIVITNEGYELLGNDIGHKATELLDFIMDHDTVTTSKVASYFDISAQNASARLKKLHSLGLVMSSKQTAETGGMEFVYTAIK